MRWWLVGLACVVGCGGSSNTANDDARWDDGVASFAAATCDSPCETSDHTVCKSDLVEDFMAARDELDASGGSRDACLACLRAKTDAAPLVAANHCTPTAAIDQMVFAICDLDPKVDYDGDGILDNDDDEACGGYP
jgi:hypothetical protein